MAVLLTKKARVVVQGITGHQGQFHTRAMRDFGTKVVAGVTPFLASWYWKKFKAAKFLALHGADVNFRDPKNGKTALHYGIEKQFDPALLRWLVEHGASPEIADDEGTTARQLASRKRDKRWFSALERTG